MKHAADPQLAKASPVNNISAATALRPAATGRTQFFTAIAFSFNNRGGVIDHAQPGAMNCAPTTNMGCFGC
jgi:hypothetical protein